MSMEAGSPNPPAMRVPIMMRRAAAVSLLAAALAGVGGTAMAAGGQGGGGGHGGSSTTTSTSMARRASYIRAGFTPPAVDRGPGCAIDPCPPPRPPSVSQPTFDAYLSNEWISAHRQRCHVHDRDWLGV